MQATSGLEARRSDNALKLVRHRLEMGDIGQKSASVTMPGAKAPFMAFLGGGQAGPERVQKG
jgi:hypothetical protein